MDQSPASVVANAETVYVPDAIASLRAFPRTEYVRAAGVPRVVDETTVAEPFVMYTTKSVNCVAGFPLNVPDTRISTPLSTEPVVAAE
jgi:hypothetical protein